MKTLHAARFLVTGPLVFLLLIVIHRMVTPGADWLKWAALGMGIAWVVSLLRVAKAALLLGGIGAVIALLRRR